MDFSLFRCPCVIQRQLHSQVQMRALHGGSSSLSTPCASGLLLLRWPLDSLLMVLCLCQAKHAPVTKRKGIYGGLQKLLDTNSRNGSRTLILRHFPLLQI